MTKLELRAAIRESLHGRSAADALEWFEERAAIRQYEGGLSREDAERAAEIETLEFLEAKR